MFCICSILGDLTEPKIMIMNDGIRYCCNRCGVKYKKGKQMTSIVEELWKRYTKMDCALIGFSDILKRYLKRLP